MSKNIKNIYAIDQSKFRESKTFSSLRSLQNIFSSKGLVKISASWWSVLIWQTLMSPFCWWSLKKWCQMSRCVVRLCSTGLSVKRIALSLAGLCSDRSQSPAEFASSKIVARNTGLRQHTQPRRWIRQHMFVSLNSNIPRTFLETIKSLMCFPYQLWTWHSQSLKI
jgi:hypothetical protein